MDKNKKATIEELMRPENRDELIREKKDDTLSLDEPTRKMWLRIIIGLFILIILLGLGYILYTSYTAKKELTKEEKIENPVSTNTNQDTNNGEKVPSVVYVDASDGLNLRSQASSASEIVTLLPDKAQLTVLEQNDGWYKVTYNGKTGYVSAQFTVKVLPPAQ